MMAEETGAWRAWANPNLPSYSHVDQHAITFHPNYDGESNQIALIGNDGGIFRTTNARAATSNGPLAACTGGQPIQVAWTSLNRGYGVTQFYHGTPFPDGTQYLAGAQDNNTLLGSDATGPDGWRPVFGGDGGFSAVHPTQTSTWLMEFQWASLGRTTNGGLTISAIANGPRSHLREQYRPGRQLPVHPAVHARSGNQQHLAGRQLLVSRTLVRADVAESRLRDARGRPHQRDCGVVTHRRHARDWNG